MKSEIVNPPRHISQGSLRIQHLKLYLDMVSDSPADNVTTRVALTFSWRIKMLRAKAACDSLSCD